ncbi:MAG TPA: MFS transporter [Trebonia sp.]|nr:MFS transporter [Trebonia sp.]
MLDDGVDDAGDAGGGQQGAGPVGASESQLQWITAAYTLAWAGLLLPAGKLGDKLGRRKVLTAGLALFAVASVAASQVTTAGELIALRAVMGAGAAVIMPMGLAILPVLFPGETDRRRAVTVTTIGAMVALPLGPLLGGWLLTHVAWGWIFLINAPVAALALAGVCLLVPESRDLTNPRLEPGRERGQRSDHDVAVQADDQEARGDRGQRPPAPAARAAGAAGAAGWWRRRRTGRGHCHGRSGCGGRILSTSAVGLRIGHD